MTRKCLVISGINFFEGGPLTVYYDCLHYINGSDLFPEYRVVALVHKLSLFRDRFQNIEFFEFPKARKSYLYRLYYEYFYFRKFSALNKVTFWLSLHDISPNVGKIEQAVYCHNPTPFGVLNIRDIYLQPTNFFFTLFYKFLYRINIRKNKFVIVQQLWIKNKFSQMFALDPKKIIVSKPEKKVGVNAPMITGAKKIETKKIFFFPTFPRPFKNIEIIGEAVALLRKDDITDFEIVITIDGSENRYAKSVFAKYKNSPQINFTGKLPREDVYKIYQLCDALIFPSKLETWGLPISEFKQFYKPVLAADLPYARETVGAYKKAVFFDPSKPVELYKLLKQIIVHNKIEFEPAKEVEYPMPYAESWEGLFSILLK